MPGTRSGAIARAHECYDSGAYLDRLRALVAVPTESQLPERLPDLRRYCEQTLPPLLVDMGFAHEVLENPEAGRGPVLLATRIEDPSRPTVLVYGHGDVVRGLAPQWHSDLDPFAVTVEGDRWYGRGTVDNKGQHLIAIESLRATLAERGALGFAERLALDRAERVGSPGLAEYLDLHKDRCAADVFIALDGPRQTTFLPELSLGARGAVAFDLVVDFRATEHHSGHFGGVLDDAGFVLAHALSSIVTPRGKILVEDWLPKDVPASVTGAIDALTIEDIPGVPQGSPDWGEPGLSKPRRIYGWTSVIVLAFTCGHPDAPTNAVQGRARARLQVRHTVDLPAETIVPALRRHLDAKGFGLLGQPAAQVAQRDDVVAFVVHGLGHKEVRYLGGFVGALQQVDVVALDFGVQRGAQFLPVGEQFVQGARLEDRTGEDVSADFGTLLDHADADFFAGFSGLLLQSAGGGQAGRAGADDDDVEFHKFAFHRLSPTQGSSMFYRGGYSSLPKHGAGIISTPSRRANTNVCLKNFL